MGIEHGNVGKRYDEHVYEVTPEAIKRYAEAVNDGNPAYGKGPDAIAPPLFPIVSGWDAMAGAVADTVSGDLLIRTVHLIQDMRFHRPIRAGDTLRSRGRISGIVGGDRGTSVVCHVETTDRDGQPVGEFYATSYIRGHSGEPTTGDPAPTLERDRHGDPIGVAEQSIDADQTFRYAEASGDHNPIHKDEDVAKSVGLPGIIVHGMCTLGVVCAAAVEHLADGDPSRMKRFAGRFSRPVLPGQALKTTFWRSGGGNGRGLYTFLTEGPDGPVVKDGVAEIA